MVVDNPFEEPNLSYVRVNQHSNAKAPLANDKVPGTGESIKCHITKNMSPSDPLVVNAELLHKSMVDQLEPNPQPTVPLWTPVHLYASEERRPLLHARDEWTEVSQDMAAPQTDAKRVGQTTVSKTISKQTTKRSLDDATDQNESRAKISRTDMDTETHLQATLKRNQTLEKINMDLQDKVRELEQRVEIMSKIMKDPNKLSLLMTHLQGLRHSQGTKMTRATVPCAQG